MQSLRGSAVAVVVGLVGGLYGSLGVVQAAQNAFNKVWAVPRNARPNPVKARLRSLLMLLIVGLGVIVSTALSALTTVADRIGDAEVGAGLRIGRAGRLGGAQRGAAGARLPAADRASRCASGTCCRAPSARRWPGSCCSRSGTYYLGNTLRGTSATYGLFGVVLGLLVWLYLSAFAVVLGAEVNVVRARRLWPRSLLTPFTDDVHLTRGDRKAYASYAETERHKGFETVEVDFDQAAPGGGRARERVTGGGDARTELPPRLHGRHDGTCTERRPGRPPGPPVPSAGSHVPRRTDRGGRRPHHRACPPGRRRVSAGAGLRT